MRRSALLAAALAALAAPSLAQQPVPGIEDLRPEEMRFPDNLGLEELPIPVAPLPKTDPSQEALSISSDVLGPRAKVDEAYGAFQRGFFLTALELPAMNVYESRD